MAENKTAKECKPCKNLPSFIQKKIDEKKGKTDKNEKKPCSKKCASSYRVSPEHKMYIPLLQRAAKGMNTVKLANQQTYEFAMDEKNNLILKIANSQKIMKESQTVSPKVVKLDEDPDLGKVKADETHSMAADEKKPSEGVKEPEVPEAPNGGRLTNESTVEKAKDGPEVPAGGGMNPDYDENEKNKPEKMDQMLGKPNEVVASSDEATKLAGRMLKANLINVDELPDTVKMLSKATPEILKDYDKRVFASQSQGLQKEATAGAFEKLPVVPTGEPMKLDLKDAVRGLFTLTARNDQYEKYVNSQ